MVTREDNSRDAADGYPAGSLQGLSRLVDEERAELLSFEQAIGRAHQRTGDDTSLAEELGIDAHL